MKENGVSDSVTRDRTETEEKKQISQRKTLISFSLPIFVLTCTLLHINGVSSSLGHN